MKKYNFLLSFVLLLIAFSATAQGICPNSNTPAPPGDSIQSAPFFCGNYLDGYCGNNFGFSSSQAPAPYSAYGQADAWLRFSPCDDSLSLSVTVSNCLNNNGLTLALASLTFGALQVLNDSFTLAPNNGTIVLNFNGLQTDSTYYLWINGTASDQCQFEVSVLSGIGTADPAPIDCVCSSSNIQGPDALCAGTQAVYTFNPGNCTITVGSPTGGNGYNCYPPNVCPVDTSSGNLVPLWHSSSPSITFFPDSIGFTVTVKVDSALLNVDTILNATIWVTMIDTTSFFAAQDSLTFCDCQGIICNAGGASKGITIENHFESYYCLLTCLNAVCFVDGQSYTSPGVYTYTKSPCTQVTVTIDADFVPPFILPQSPNTICQGASITLTPNLIDPWVPYIFQWNTGDFSPSITVSPFGSTTYGVMVTNPFNGCQAFDNITVLVEPVQITNLGTITICEGQVYTQCNIPFTAPGNYSVNCPSGGFCDDIFLFTLVVTPKQTISLGVVGSVSCDNPCLTVSGQQYCAPGTYTITGVCADTIFEIEFFKPLQELGIAGTITCTLPCVTVQGQSYCQPGDYTVEDNCYRYHFVILQETSIPVCSAPVHDCLPTNTAFTVSFSITGVPPFKVNGVLISGNLFVSSPVPNGDPYTFVVEGGNGCLTIVSGTYDCSNMCLSVAGTMATQVLALCTGDQAQGLVQTAPLIGAGDAMTFVLHSSSGASLGTLVARNSSGIFDFLPGQMSYGLTYYISQAVGPVDAQGQVDLTALCCKISTGQPVVFHETLESVELSIKSPLCKDDPLGSIEVNPIAGGASVFSYSIDNVSFVSENIFENLLPGQYSIVIKDQYGCTFDTSAEINTAQPIELTLPAEQTFNLGQSVLINASTNILPASIEWTATPGGPLQHPFLSLEVRPTENVLYTLRVFDQNGCSDTKTILLKMLAAGEIYQPNVISRAAEREENRYFTLFSTNQYLNRIVTLSIFNRWGEKVWEGLDLAPNQSSAGWNGTSGGKKCLPGLYVYVAEVQLFDGSKQTFRGDVTLVE